MHRFSERLRASLIVRGVDPTPENLSQLSGLSITRAAEWLGMKDAPRSLTHAARVAQATHSRLFWLVTGEGSSGARALYTDLEQRAMSVMDALSPEEAQRWLEAGEKLVRT